MIEQSETSIFRLMDGVVFRSGPSLWSIDPIKVSAGEWVAFVPKEKEPVIDASGPLARMLCTLSEPEIGSVELLGKDVYRLPYRDIQRARADLGFVQGYGGLLSNNTIRENIALPASVHGGFSMSEEKELVQRFITNFSLDKVADLQPHDMDGATRWRSCLARAMVLSPRWLVLEGLGDWEMDRGRGVAWTNLKKSHDRGKSAIAVCLSRKNPEFEAWFENNGGRIIVYSSLSEEELLRRRGI